MLRPDRLGESNLDGVALDLWFLANDLPCFRKPDFVVPMKLSLEPVELFHQPGNPGGLAFELIKTVSDADRAGIHLPLPLAASRLGLVAPLDVVSSDRDLGPFLAAGYRGRNDESQSRPCDPSPCQ